MIGVYSWLRYIHMHSSEVMSILLTLPKIATKMYVMVNVTTFSWSVIKGFMIFVATNSDIAPLPPQGQGKKHHMI